MKHNRDMSNIFEQAGPQKKLTDAELQQATGDEIAPSMYKWNCKGYGDEASCLKRKPCEWKKGKNGYHCDYPTVARNPNLG